VDEIRSTVYPVSPIPLFQKNVVNSAKSDTKLYEVQVKETKAPTISKQ
jgi:hypothetical protein